VSNSNRSHRHYKDQDSDAAALDKFVTRVGLEDVPEGETIFQNKAHTANNSANDVWVNGNHFPIGSSACGTLDTNSLRKVLKSSPRAQQHSNYGSRLTINSQCSRDGSEPPAGAQEQYAFQCRRRQQMYIDPANAPTHEAMPLDERHHFLILHDRHGWQSPEQLQDLRAAAYGSTCQFADNKTMALNFGVMKKRDEPELAMAQMLHPDRGIHKYQRLARGARGRRRRIFRTRGSLPPIAASLLALSRGDKGFQSGVNHSSLLSDTAEPCRLLEKVIVNVQSRPHMYEYA